MTTHQHTDKSSTSTAVRANKSKPQTGAHPAQILQRLESAPDSIRAADVLVLQRTIGNRATGRLLQTKLKLGPAGDKYEQEADRVAQQVVHASRQPDVQRADLDEEELQAKPLAADISRVQRSVMNPTTQPSRYADSIANLRRDERPDPWRRFVKPTVQREGIEEDELQAAPAHGLEGGDVDADVARSIQSAKGSGQPLHDGVRSSMEGAFGADFSGVNVHTGPQADALNRSLDARAFTTGSDIFFGSGEYNPGSSGGQELIAHELTHTVQQGAAGVQRQLQSARLIQRTPNLNRLKEKLGQGKFAKVTSAKQEEYFDKLTDDQLLRYRGMQNSKFDELVGTLKEGLLSGLASKTADVAQIADLLGAAVETGEDAAQVAQMLPMLLNTMSGVVSTGADTAMEGFGGGIGGIKDTIEGGSSVVKQHKFVEGGLTTLSGISGIASLIPGVPDVVGMAGGGAKSVAGMTKVANTRINQNAITRLKTEGAANAPLLAALAVLESKLSYWEGVQQTALGAVEGTGAFFGGLGKWGTSLFSKGVETLPGLLKYTGRAIGSSITSSIDSNAIVKKGEEAEKAGEIAKMRAAVETVERNGLPEHIGRLHRLVVLIEPDFAEEIDRSVNLLSSDLRGQVKAAIKAKATWNPS